MPSKLHLNISSKPACGRQLNNHREARAQLQDRVALAASAEVFLAALQAEKPSACRHCAREVGLLPKITRQPPAEDDTESETDMLYRELTEDQDEEEGSDE